MAALLSSEIEDSNKRDIMVEHIEDARRLGAEVLPPSVNDGDVEFTVAGGKIVFGLTAIKGVGRGAAQEIVRARREAGPFRDLFDFCDRIDMKIVPRTAIEKLIKAGAFDCFIGAKRAQLMHVLSRALQSAADAQSDRRAGQKNLFIALGDEEATPERIIEALPDIPEWPDSEKLKNEKEALDFYFSSHPLAQHESMLRRFGTHTVDKLSELGESTDP